MPKTLTMKDLRNFVSIYDEINDDVEITIHFDSGSYSNAIKIEYNDNPRNEKHSVDIIGI